MMQSFIDFASSFDNFLEFPINNDEQYLNTSNHIYDDVSFHYVSILSDMATQNLVIVILLAIIDIFFVLPSNLLTFIVIVRNKELMTPSNIVLSINGIIQCIGTAIYLVFRILWVYVLFFVPMVNNYKESVYTVLWWIYALMMRTGNNRLVNMQAKDPPTAG